MRHQSKFRFMYSNSDFEKLWFLYTTEGEPKGISINSFCVSQGVPFNQFNDWFRKTHKKIVPEQIDGIPSDDVGLANIDNYLEQQVVKPAAPYNPSSCMNESELRNYVRFLYEQVHTKDKSIQELLEK